MAKVKRLGAPLELECKRCYSLVIYTVDDVEVDEMLPTVLRCPVCFIGIHISDLDLPDGWEGLIRIKYNE